MFSFLRSATGTPAPPTNPGTAPKPTDLFTPTDPAVDGEDCLHDCDACSVRYPRGFKIEETDDLYGKQKGWATHLLIATSKTDWKREVTDEKGSVMEAVEKAEEPGNGVSLFLFFLEVLIRESVCE